MFAVSRIVKRMVVLGVLLFGWSSWIWVAQHCGWKCETHDRHADWPWQQGILPTLDNRRRTSLGWSVVAIFGLCWRFLFRASSRIIIGSSSAVYHCLCHLFINPMTIIIFVKNYCTTYNQDQYSRHIIGRTNPVVFSTCYITRFLVI